MRSDPAAAAATASAAAAGVRRRMSKYSKEPLRSKINQAVAAACGTDSLPLERASRVHKIPVRTLRRYIARARAGLELHPRARPANAPRAKRGTTPRPPRPKRSRPASPRGAQDGSALRGADSRDPAGRGVDASARGAENTARVCLGPSPVAAAPSETRSAPNVVAAAGTAAPASIPGLGLQNWIDVPLCDHIVDCPGFPWDTDWATATGSPVGV